MIHLLHSSATSAQLKEMLEAGVDFIKVVVDIKRGILAGGGGKHSDSEAALLETGSLQEDLWGATWWAEPRLVIYESMVNFKPRQENRSMLIADQAICDKVENIINQLLEGL